MRRRALVVEDDEDVIEQIGDSLCSIEHDFSWVITQQDARKALEAEDCVLLGDLLEYELAPRAEAEAEVVALLRSQASQQSG